MARNPPLGGTPISERPASPKATTVIGSILTDAGEAGDAIMAERLRDQPRAEKHGGLGEGVGGGLNRPPVQALMFQDDAVSMREREREHQE